MEPFIVSALKYRPQTFEDVVGQSAITNTLKMLLIKTTLHRPYCLLALEGLVKLLVLGFLPK